MTGLHAVRIEALRNVALVVAFLLTNAMAGGWKLLWSDEFDSTALNDGYWAAKAYPAGAFNNEEERYVAGHDQSTSNVFVKNGNLIIVAKNAGGITSGRIEGGGLKSFTYGRMEARMRLPVTDGMWPAFWMLGVGGSWPACGELDIMEGKGRFPNWTSGSFHFTNFDRTNQYVLPKGNVHDDFHIYAAEMTADSVRWYFDTVNFATITKNDDADLPFDKPYYFILNLAVGGNFDVASDNTTDFPESLIVDYVRVFNWDPTLDAHIPAAAARAPVTSITVVARRLLVELPSCQAYAAELVSPDGRRMVATSGNAKSLSLPLRGLASGLYFATVRGEFGTLSKRVAVRQ